MRTIGAFEAKNTLGALLDLAAGGEELVITRHGKEVARLVPPRGTVSRDTARKAAERIRGMSTDVTLGGLSIKDLVNKGRR